jgi:hypothetical protein
MDMKKTDFRTPILQSGALLFIFLLFFFFVTSSEADGFGTGLLAIASGVFRSILFAVGLFLSIFFSITVLVGLFLAAVALYSLDKARYLSAQLQVTLEQIFTSLNNNISLKTAQYLDNCRSQSSKIHQLEKEVRDLTGQNQSLRYSLNKVEIELEQLQAVNSTNEKSNESDSSSSISANT